MDEPKLHNNSFATPERLAMVEAAIAGAAKRKAKERASREEINRYTLEFDCTPSVFEQIKSVIKTYEIRTVSARFYPLNGKGKE